MAFRPETQHRLYTSDIVAVAATATITGAVKHFEDYYIGMRYYADSAGAATAVPGAGTVAIQVLDEATNEWTAVTGSPLTGTDVTDKVIHAGNAIGIRAVPTGLTVATHMQLFVSANL